MAGRLIIRSRRFISPAKARFGTMRTLCSVILPRCSPMLPLRSPWPRGLHVVGPKPRDGVGMHGRSREARYQPLKNPSSWTRYKGACVSVASSWHGFPNARIPQRAEGRVKSENISTCGRPSQVAGMSRMRAGMRVWGRFSMVAVMSCTPILA